MTDVISAGKTSSDLKKKKHTQTNRQIKRGKIRAGICLHLQDKPLMTG